MPTIHQVLSMGITGLLPMLSDVTLPVHIARYRGRRVAVDSYCWLHKGAYGSAEELCRSDPFSQDHHAIVEYVMSRVKILLDHQIIPVMVFDGAYLPMKAGKEVERSQKREEALTKARCLKEKGKHAESRKWFVKALDITPELAWKVIKRLNVLNIQSIVAPYEADAQLAFLSQNKLVDVVISEDSDLLIFGCKRVFFKMDNDGFGKEICLKNLGNAAKLRMEGWCMDQFRIMAILSGCDYLPSLLGIGLKKAQKLIQEHKTLQRVIRKLQFDGKVVVPDTYELEVKKALLTFKYQLVFDHLEQKLRHLNPIEDEEKERILEQVGEINWDFVGTFIDNEIAKDIAKGRRHPVTHKEFEKETIKVIDPIPKGKEVSSKYFEGSIEKPKTSSLKKTKVASRVQTYLTNIVNSPKESQEDTLSQLSLDSNSSGTFVSQPRDFVSPFVTTSRVTRIRKSSPLSSISLKKSLKRVKKIGDENVNPNLASLEKFKSTRENLVEKHVKPISIAFQYPQSASLPLEK